MCVAHISTREHGDVPELVWMSRDHIGILGYEDLALPLIGCGSHLCRWLWALHLFLEAQRGWLWWQGYG